MNENTKKIHFTHDKERCKGCNLCIDVCPQKALAESEDVNEKGFKYIVMKHPEKCNGCGLCVLMCPDCGIEIETEDKK